MTQPNSGTNKQPVVDAGILEVVIALAALSVVIVGLPLEIPDLVTEWFTPP